MATPLIFDTLEPETTGLVILDAQGEVLLVADATTDEGATASADITQYPRQGLVDGSDGIQPRAIEVTTTLFFTVSPLTQEADPRRVAAAWETLRGIQTGRQVVTLITGWRVFESMALASAPISARGYSGSITCSWRQIEVAQVQSAQVPANVLAAIARSSAKPRDKTKDQVAPASPRAEAARKKTGLKALADGVRQ